MNAALAVIQQRQSVTMMVSRDSGLRQLRQQIAIARIDKLASAAYLDSSINARNIALDYSGYVRRTGYLNNSYGGAYTNGFYPFGYGAGYGTSYGYGNYRAYR